VVVPPVPDVPEAQRARARLWLRYEDVAQDGHLLAAAMPQAVGAVFWRKLGPAWLGGLHPTGVIAILNRLSCEQGQAPLGVAEPLWGEARAALCHAVDEHGEVDRILLRVWVELRGKPGRVWGPVPADLGDEIVAGRVFAEHTFTRPFAPPGKRKVRRLEAKGLPEIPGERVAAFPASALLALPDDAALLGDWRRDPAGVVFGVDHTDSNQHVNSLAYPRLFVDAAMRHLAELGERTTLRVAEQHTAFRKPSFAGDALALATRAYRRGDRLGVAVELLDSDRPAGTEGRVCGRLELVAS
jgi:hypothetical protein